MGSSGLRRRWTRYGPRPGSRSSWASQVCSLGSLITAATAASVRHVARGASAARRSTATRRPSSPAAAKRTSPIMAKMSVPAGRRKTTGTGAEAVHVKTKAFHGLGGSHVRFDQRDPLAADDQVETSAAIRERGRGVARVNLARAGVNLHHLGLVHQPQGAAGDGGLISPGERALPQAASGRLVQRDIGPPNQMMTPSANSMGTPDWPSTVRSGGARSARDARRREADVPFRAVVPGEDERAGAERHVPASREEIARVRNPLGGAVEVHEGHLGARDGVEHPERPVVVQLRTSQHHVAAARLVQPALPFPRPAPPPVFVS